MSPIRTLLALVALLVAGQVAVAGSHDQHVTVNAPKASAKHKMAKPAVQIYDLKDAATLEDALQLTAAQRTALDACTATEHVEVAAATTPADVTAAQQRYLNAVGQVLTTSQFKAYVALNHCVGYDQLTTNDQELARR